MAPCSDSSSSMTILLDSEEKFLSFEYAKITCGQEIAADTGLRRYFLGWDLPKILEQPFSQIQKDLKVKDEEAEFVMYLEWDVLRSAVAQYLGVFNEEIDAERCLISSIGHSAQGIEVVLVVLPPKELPKILPCSLGQERKEELYKKSLGSS